MMRRRIGAALALGWVVVGACNALTSVGEYRYDGTCTADGDCDDQNPCTLDVCFERVCTHDPMSATPVIVGNCQKELCHAGVLVFEPDPMDVEDGDPCTDDVCTDDAGAIHTPKKFGDSCSVGQLQGGCKGGKCVVPCDQGMTKCDEPDDCFTGSCVAMECVFTQRDAGAPCGLAGVCSLAGICE